MIRNRSYPLPGVRSTLAALVLLTACGSGSPTTTTVTGTIALSLSPGAATIQQGGSTQVTGTVVRTNFTGDIANSTAAASYSSRVETMSSGN